jgi:CRP-like cAMP-binding protein
MNAHDLANDIAAIPFLTGMNDRHIKVLANCACRTHFDEGQIIFHQGETANRFYLIEEGTIQLEAALTSGARSIVAGSIDAGGFSAGLGYSRHINGNSPRVLYPKQAQSFFTELSCANVAKRTRRSVSNCSNEWARKWLSGCNLRGGAYWKPTRDFHRSVPSMHS